MIFFWILWSIDALVSLVLLYFFFEGLADGSVSSYNGIEWFVILAVLTAIMLGSLGLRSKGKMGLAIAALLVLAIPALLYGAFIAMFLILDPNWQ